jgi:cellobiose phosphorylase
MYRLISETLLGLVLHGGTRLSFKPCVPAAWKSYKINYRFHATHYRIQFMVDSEPTHHVKRIALDGVEQGEKFVSLVDDQQEHHVEVYLGI